LPAAAPPPWLMADRSPASYDYERGRWRGEWKLLRARSERSGLSRGVRCGRTRRLKAQSGGRGA
jgi:hypothetical protein